MSLTSVEESLLLAAYFRGRCPGLRGWTSNTDQILTLSLFYSGEIPFADCVSRFAERRIRKLYIEDGKLTEEDGDWKLTEEIETRYKVLINLLHTHPELIEGGGNFKSPAHPTFTACGLTNAGLDLASSLINLFPQKPEFPDWPDNQTIPESNQS